MFNVQDRAVEKQVNLGKCSIAYLQGGTSSDSVPVLFLHGWGIAAKPYGEIFDLLTQHHQVIMPDLPGFAGSRDCGLVPSYDRYAELLLSFLAALNVDKVHLVGHSIGGGIGITIAALAPEKVASLILVDSTGIPSVPLLEIPFRRALEMTLQISPSKLYLQFSEIPQAFVPNLIFNFPNVITALLLALEKDLRSLLPLIQAPCLLLWSRKDLTTPLDAAEEFHQTIKNSRLVIVEEGYHEWGLWYPEKFSAIVSSFVDEMSHDRDQQHSNSAT